ncbi:MAG TPA: hypothetical protein VGH38_09005, partial [Bryobacteraceae bacterium]
MWTERTLAFTAMQPLVRQGLALAAAGVASGAMATFGVSRLMGSMLFEVSPHDPLAIGGAALL